MKSHKTVKSDTVSRWIKNKVSSAGVDISVYKLLSDRSASSSKVRHT